MSLVEQALKKVQQARFRPADSLPAVDPVSVALLPEEPSVVARVDSVEEIVAGGAVITVSRDQLRRAGLLPPIEQERQIANEYRQVKRPLVQRAFGRGADRLEDGRVVMVASAMPGDGKTFTSVNLALSLALEKDISVLLVDTDVAKRHLSEVFGLGKEKGLLDVLRDPDMQIESVIYPTDIRGLSILPAGKSMENATELLASERMRQMMHRIDSMPDQIVVLDSPPLLLTSESRVIASLAGQIVLVVCAERTPQRAVVESLEMLGEGKSVGIVLNQGSEHSSHYGYGYYGSNPEAEQVVT